MMPHMEDGAAPTPAAAPRPVPRSRSSATGSRRRFSAAYAALAAGTLATLATAAPSSARQAGYPDVPLVLATDGTEFAFEITVDDAEAGKVQDTVPIFHDSGGAVVFQLVGGNRVEFLMDTLNSGSVKAAGDLAGSGKNLIFVTKGASTLCVKTTKGSNCVDTTDQMKTPASLSWGVGTEVAMEYYQLAGSVHMSFVLQGIPDGGLNTMKAQVAKMEVNHAIASTVALVGGYGVTSSAVSIVHAPFGASGTSVHLTAKNLGDQAPAVLVRLQEGKDKVLTELKARVERSTRLNEVVSTTSRRLAPSVTVDNLQIPAVATGCSEWKCNDFTKVMPGSKCAGSTCDDVCCGPTTCDKVTCPSGLKTMDPSAMCNDETSCIGTCCGTKCSEKTGCPIETCPVASAYGKKVAISEYVDKCCSSTEAPCCDGATAYCLACKVCMKTDEFCKAASGNRRLRSVNETAGVELRIRRLAGAASDDPDSRSTVGAFQLKDWMKKYTGKTIRGVAEPKPAAQNGSPKKLTTKVNEHESKVQKVLAEDHLRTGTSSKTLINAMDEGTPVLEEWKTDLAAARDTVLGRVSSDCPGCDDTSTPTCEVVQVSTFNPADPTLTDPGASLGPVTTVKVLRAGVRAVVGNEGSGNLFQFNLATGIADIPLGRHAEGTEPDQGVLVAGAEEDGHVTASELMLDGQHGVVGFSSGMVIVFNAGDIDYPPDVTMPESQDKLMNTRVNAIASMPSWKMMLLGMESSWTLIFNFINGGVIRVPRNVTTRNESIARRQVIIKKAFDERFATGSNPTEADKKAFYKEIAHQLRENQDLTESTNAQEIASWKNVNNFGAVKDVVYVPVNTRFATAHADGRVRYWNAMNGAQIAQMAGHVGPVNALAAHPGKEWVVSGGQDGTVRVWDFVTSTQVLLFDQKVGGPVLSLAIVPPGQFVYVGSFDGVVRKYDINSGEPVCHFLTNAGSTTSMAADPLVPGQIVIGTELGVAKVYV